MKWDEYRGLKFEHRDDGVLLITIHGSGRLNSVNEECHHELATVWRDVDDDPKVKVAVVTGYGEAFCAGGAMELERQIAGNPVLVAETMQNARNLVLNMINCDKPVISAINGPAAGAGLAVALLADIAIISETTKFTDGHVRIGLAAGDHATLIWPLLCGMANSKYYLLTGDFLSGREAADIGLVFKAVPSERVADYALEIAARLASGPQSAVRATKRSLNHWLRMVAPAWEASLGLEMLNLFGSDFLEGLDAFEEKRPPRFGGSYPADPPAQ